jgi:hypothetical protein
LPKAADCATQAAEVGGSAEGNVRRFAYVGFLLALALVRPAQAAEPVDLALVLATDVSLSMAEDETKIQRRGYAAALRNPQVIDAIRSGQYHRIALAYVEWSSVTDQRLLIDWRVVTDQASAEAVAAELEKLPVKTGTTTSISAGLDFSAKLIEASPFTATRRVIDVSGDGYSDYGRPIRMARDETVKAGITINGLPVMNQRPPWRESAPPDLDKYYTENVVGGPGSFSLVVRDLKDFGDAVVRKMILEIAGREGAEPRRG